MMRRQTKLTLTLCIAIIAVAVLAAAGPAAAAVTPLAHVMPDAFDTAVDGTDVYWLEQTTWHDKNKHEVVFGTQLKRGSLLDNSVALLGRYDDADNDIPESIKAGGGMLYVSFADQNTVAGPSYEESVKVVRMSRDGLNPVTIAKVGSSPTGDYVFEHGVPRLSDCTKSVEATSVSSTGDAVISQRTSTREASSCGRKKNIDAWRYYEVTTSGATREIASEQSRVTAKFTFHRKRLTKVEWGSVSPPIADPWVYYGKAVYQKHHAGNIYIRDLTSGLETGPYRTRIPGHDFFVAAQINAAGQLAVTASAATGDKKHEKYHVTSGLFRTPGDPGSFARMKGSAQLEFCGEHLIAVNNRGARELDPATFALQRIVAPGRDVEGDDTFIEPGCNGQYIYFTRLGPVKTVLLGYPLN